MITIEIWALLIWTHYNGGVPSHHLLHRKELPAISNWWSGLLIPLLSWFLLYRIQKRIFQKKNEKSQVTSLFRIVKIGFTVALFYGALIAVLFIYNVASIPSYLLLSLLLIAFFYPIYLAECILGFVMGMTVTFGAFLPTIVAFVFSLIGFLIYQFIRPAIAYIMLKIFHKASLNK